MPKTLVQTEVIVAAVRRLRENYGACTFAQLAAEIGIGKAATRTRVETLKKREILDFEPGLAGSIRLGPKAPRPRYDLHMRVVLDGTGKPVDVEWVNETPLPSLDKVAE